VGAGGAGEGEEGEEEDEEANRDRGIDGAKGLGVQNMYVVG
jgi:hypothetical protein